ncbi:MAG: hypothetical protein ABSE77_07005 [Acidimicrobiales bacterium]
MALTAREALLGDLGGSAGNAVLAEERTLPLVAALADLFPGKSLRRGSTVVVSRGAFPGATSLALALLSGPCAGGSWCAVVGAAELGLVAAAQHGLDLERLALVPSPGAQWPVVTAALLEGFDVVLVCPPAHVSHSVARQLEARGRERGSVLAIVGEGWPGSADMRLGIVAGCWRGLEDGHGYLWGREVEVEAAGKGAASRPRRARFWLGGPFQVAVDGPPVLGVGSPAVLGSPSFRSIAGDEAPGRSRPQVGAGDLAG